jgi:hypothetical protein
MWRRLKVTFPDHIKSHTRQQGDYQLIPEPPLVAIDMGEITIR